MWEELGGCFKRIAALSLCFDVLKPWRSEEGKECNPRELWFSPLGAALARLSAYPQRCTSENKSHLGTPLTFTPSPEVFKARLDGSFSNLVWCCTRWSLMAPSNQSPPIMLWSLQMQALTFSVHILFKIVVNISFIKIHYFFTSVFIFLYFFPQLIY